MCPQGLRVNPGVPLLIVCIWASVARAVAERHARRSEAARSMRDALRMRTTGAKKLCVGQHIGPLMAPGRWAPAMRASSQLARAALLCLLPLASQAQSEDCNDMVRSVSSDFHTLRSIRVSIFSQLTPGP